MKLISEIKIKTAVANKGVAMEADTILKNGRSSKSQMSRGNFNLKKMKKIFLILGVLVLGLCSMSCTKYKTCKCTYYFQNLDKYSDEDKGSMSKKDCKKIEEDTKASPYYRNVTVKCSLENIY